MRWCEIKRHVHGLDVVRKLQMLNTAICSDDALLDVIAPHFSVNKFSQKMWVHNRKFWRDDEICYSAIDCQHIPPAMTRRTNMLD